MSTITIVRHAQASYLEEDYDRLSPLGERQARVLGEHWAKVGARFDYAFSGPRKRHVRTAEIAGQASRKAGLALPDPVVLPELDEYRADEVIRKHLSLLAENHSHIRALEQEFRQTKGTPAARRSIELLFRAVTTMWVRQEFETDGVETWEMFCARVRQALGQVRSNGARGANVVVFSSAGPTAVAMQLALNLEAEATLQLSWLVRNCACSEFLYSGERFSLWSFNSVPHLQDPSLVTYR